MAKRPKWTLLAYFAAERDLAEPMVLSLKDLYGAAATSRCNVLAQLNVPGAAPRRFRIVGAAHDRVEDSTLARRGEVVPMEQTRSQAHVAIGAPPAEANRALLESFVVAGIEESPSEHYLLVLSGHASGVVGRRRGEEGFAPGPMRTLDLSATLHSVKRKTGRAVDVLGLDACFMSLCEVGWEVRDSVRFLVASEGLTPQFGWPYQRLVELVRDGAALGPDALARAVVSRYLRYRADFDLADQSVDLSACDVTRMNELAAALTRLVEEMEARLEDAAFRDALLLSHWKAQSYKTEQYVDLWDFCELLGAQDLDDAARSACRGVQQALTSASRGVVLKSIFNGPAYQHSHGLSIYFPWSSVAPEYGGFDFAERTGWRRFLTKYVTATRRELREA